MRRARAEGGIAKLQLEHLDAESISTHFRDVAVGMIPGLLQTPDYAAAVMRASDPAIGGSELAAGVMRRIERQRQVFDFNEERLFQFLLDPSSVHISYTAWPERAVQLRHLHAVALRPNVQLRVLGGEKPVTAPLLHNFTIHDAVRVVIELAHAEIYVADADDVEQYLKHFERLWDSALDEQESMTLLGSLVCRCEEEVLRWYGGEMGGKNRLPARPLP